MRSDFVLLAAISLGGQAIAQTPAPGAIPAYDYSTSVPVTGQWTYGSTPGGSVANFQGSGARPQLSFSCVRSTRRISISRPAIGAAPFVMVWTSAERRNIPASFNPATGLISAGLGAYDKLFDSIAFSRGRLAVGPSNGAALVAPMWPDVIRVIEDCRS